MKRSINHKRYSGYPEELSMLKGFKVVGVGCGDIDKEGATSIMLMNDHNVAVDLNITDEGTYISEFYALTEDFIPKAMRTIREEKKKIATSTNRST